MTEHPTLADRAQRLARAIYSRAGLTIDPPRIVVRDVQRGRHAEKSRLVVLPLWLFDTEAQARELYFEWYVAHECAHDLASERGHGLEFQMWLRHLAPDAWHWERGYKRRQYDAARRFVHDASP